MMKKSIILAASCLVVCSIFAVVSCSQKEKADTCENPNSLMQFMSGDVLVTINEGAPMATKGAFGIDWYTIIGELNSTRYSLYLESSKGEDSLVINKIFSEGGTWIFSEILLDGKFVGDEYADFDGEFDGVETKAARRKNEKYIDCVERVHEALKSNAENNTDVTCEFVSCGALAAIVAIVDCAEYGDK